MRTEKRCGARSKQISETYSLLVHLLLYSALFAEMVSALLKAKRPKWVHSLYLKCRSPMGRQSEIKMVELLPFKVCQLNLKDAVTLLNIGSRIRMCFIITYSLNLD